MSLEITVRGTAQRSYPAERAVIELTAAVEGPDKDQVFKAVTAVQKPLTAQLGELADRGSVVTWSSDQVRIYSQRPWGPDGTRLGPTHYAHVGATAEFADFERLSGFIDYWAGRDGVEIDGIAWDVSAKNRRAHEADVRRMAVDDAVLKAQAYSDALRRGRVQAIQLADPALLRPSRGDSIMAMTGSSRGGVGSAAQVRLIPEAIVITVDVDAKFVAD